VLDVVDSTSVNSIAFEYVSQDNQRRETMKGISAVLLIIASLALMLACVSNQPSPAAPRVGKPLVKHLPAKIEGVELVGGTVKVKSGYKFVKQPNGTVTVARIAGGGGGLGVGGSWECSCTNGECGSQTIGGTLTCTKGTCKGPCVLVVTTDPGKKKLGIIAY
jgi:hypothetical protein